MKSQVPLTSTTSKNDSNRSIKRPWKQNYGVLVAINYDVFFLNLCYVTNHTFLKEGYLIPPEK